MTSPDDLTGLFGPPPPGPSQDVRYRQGTVLSFDPNTLSNTVDVGGTVLVDLPLLGVGEASLLTPGSVVGIITIVSTTGADTWAILGRLVTPNTPQAADAVSLLNSQIQSASVEEQINTAQTAFDDLPGSFGPSVAINVGPSGRILILCTCQIGYIDPDNGSSNGSGGWVVAEMAGANTGVANLVLLPYQQLSVGTTAGLSVLNVMSVTSQGVYEFLNPGLTFVTMKYASVVPGKPVDFSRRTITVIAL
jgi:hypothetical protein